MLDDKGLSSAVVRLCHLSEDFRLTKLKTMMVVGACSFVVLVIVTRLLHV